MGRAALVSNTLNIPLTCVEPFPPAALEAAWRWHKFGSKDWTRRQFMDQAFYHLHLPGNRSWGLYLGDELIGMIALEPIRRHYKLVDGILHVALARKAWGRGVINQAARLLIPKAFDGNPDLLRLSAVIPARYTPTNHLATVLGFKLEGTLRNATIRHGRLEDMNMYGLTREDFYGTTL